MFPKACTRCAPNLRRKPVRCQWSFLVDVIPGGFTGLLRFAKLLPWLSFADPQYDLQEKPSR
jgi:hypothetical protein